VIFRAGKNFGYSQFRTSQNIELNQSFDQPVNAVDWCSKYFCDAMPAGWASFRTTHPSVLVRDVARVLSQEQMQPDRATDRACLFEKLFRTH
jgi:hypothetical protein